MLLALWGIWSIIPRGVDNLPPQEMLQKGLEQTLSSGSFRYQAETRLTAEGKANVDFFSKVEGERVGPDQVRMIGTIMNTPVEYIQAGNCAYFKDPSGQWVTLPGNELSDSEMFYAELNPLAYFNFKDVPELKYRGIEKVNGEKLLLMELRPNLMDPLLELRLTDFYCKVWLSPKDYRLRRAMLQAKDKHNAKSGVEIGLSFWDYDQSITIKPPAVN